MLTIFWSHYTNENILLEFQFQDIFVYFMISWLMCFFFLKIFEDDFVETEARCSRNALHDPCCCQLFGTNSIQKVEVSLIFWDVVFFKMALAIFNTKKEKTSWSQPELMVHAILDLRQVLVGYKFFSFMVLKQYDEVILVAWLWNRCQSGIRDNQQCSKRLLSHT